jgi:hypothetical protein
VHGGTHARYRGGDGFITDVVTLHAQRNGLRLFVYFQHRKGDAAAWRLLGHGGGKNQPVRLVGFEHVENDCFYVNHGS